jgi:hypothetical protein
MKNIKNEPNPPPFPPLKNLTKYPKKNNAVVCVIYIYSAF